jgi:hypothetical protein
MYHTCITTGNHRVVPAEPEAIHVGGVGGGRSSFFVDLAKNPDICADLTHGAGHPNSTVEKLSELQRGVGVPKFRHTALSKQN